MGRKVPRAHNEAQGKSGLIKNSFGDANANEIHYDLKNILMNH